VRPGPTGPEVLLLRRKGRGNFAGMWVFPGGRVDDADHDPGGELATAAVAAVREAAEEAALALDVDALVPFSHWEPPPRPGTRFATWFFVTEVGPVDVVVDGAEVLEHRWVRPVDARAARDGGDIELAPPTYVTLHHLEDLGEVAAILGGPPSVDRYSTRPATDSPSPILLWRGDAGYDESLSARDGARNRLHMPARSAWRYERTLA
jgi:8-oxo-dGTP pyrophosphatase MutT (NUDIX family)